MTKPDPIQPPSECPACGRLPPWLNPNKPHRCDGCGVVWWEHLLKAYDDELKSLRAMGRRANAVMDEALGRLQAKDERIGELARECGHAETNTATLERRLAEAARKHAHLTTTLDKLSKAHFEDEERNGVTQVRGHKGRCNQCGEEFGRDGYCWTEECQMAEEENNEQP